MAWHYKKYQREQSPSDRVKYSDAEREARRQRSACGMIRIRCLSGITGKRDGITGRAWSRSRGNPRFAALNDFGFNHQGDMTGNGRHVAFGSLTRHVPAPGL